MNESSPISHEEIRIETLYNYRILDTIPEADLNRLVDLAADICDTPIAALSLVDKHRLWFKSIVGLDVCEIPVDGTFCSYAIKQNQPFIVPNASLDPRFADSLLVKGAAGIQFYAGIPLIAKDSNRIGTLCVLDTAPKELTQKQLKLLGTVAEQVMFILNARLSQHDLEHEKKKYQTMLQIAGDGVHIFDRNGDVVDVNARFCQMLGYTRLELLKMNVADWDAGFSPEMLRDKVEISFQEADVFETRHKRKDGSIIEVEISTKPVWIDGKLYLWNASRNITARKQTEKALIAARSDAEKANHAKSEFLANMSHEIRTPMNAVLGFSEILADLITDPTQRYYLDAVHRSGKTLLQLINDILDLSKIEAGKFTLQYTPVAIRALFEDIDIVFSQKARDKSIGFSVVIEDSVPTTLSLDEVRLRQILLNLVGNAIKFTQRGFVKVRVSGGRKTKTGKLDLLIEVIDSGIGIPKQQQEKIFAAFTQQDHQDASFGGTGLGLAISKRLVELMNGTIRVKSQAGKGSCFAVRLKNIQAVDSVPIKAAAPEAMKMVRFHPARILLVDDIEINRQLIRLYLASFNELTLIEAETGEQALKLVKQQSFDLILMDRRLPKMDGDRVCRCIKEMPECGAIPIIMLTASVLTLEERQQPIFYELQINKPVNKAQLLEAMRSFLPTDESVQMAQKVEEVAEKKETIEMEKLPELLALLGSHYQNQIKELSSSGCFEINLFIEIAEKLLEIADQYRCSLLADWANTLKTQTEMFDIQKLPNTLREFDVLLEHLNSL